MEVPVLTGKGTKSLVRGHAIGLSIGEPDPELLQRGPCEVLNISTLVHLPRGTINLPEDALYQFLEGKACTGYPSRWGHCCKGCSGDGCAGQGSCHQSVQGKMHDICLGEGQGSWPDPCHQSYQGIPTESIEMNITYMIDRGCIYYLLNLTWYHLK